MCLQNDRIVKVKKKMLKRDNQDGGNVKQEFRTAVM